MFSEANPGAIVRLGETVGGNLVSGLLLGRDLFAEIAERHGGRRQGGNNRTQTTDASVV